MLASKPPDGLFVAIDILQMRLHGNKNEKHAFSSAITSLGQELLVKIDFNRENNQLKKSDYKLEQLIEGCLIGEKAVSTATIICRKLVKALLEYKMSSVSFPRLLKSLAQQQPQAFLNEFLSDTECSLDNVKFIFIDYCHPNSLSYIQDTVIIDWCKLNPLIRYIKVAVAMLPHRHNEHKNSLEWTPLSLGIMDNAPDVVTVLNAFKRSLIPSSWSGSRADIMARGLTLILQLKTHQNPAISTWAGNEEKVFLEEIKQERQSEEQYNRTQDERFE
jgi:hypothetical protein